jgi:hypothetical protein
MEPDLLDRDREQVEDAAVAAKDKAKAKEWGRVKDEVVAVKDKAWVGIGAKGQPGQVMHQTQQIRPMLRVRESETLRHVLDSAGFGCIAAGL